MEDTMDTKPTEIVLTGEPFFVALEEEVQADGSKVLVLLGDGQVQLMGVPPSYFRKCAKSGVTGLTGPSQVAVFEDRTGNDSLPD
jgi:alcohol dehydrogenase YqhD (iron-dependent ADH family)